MSIFTDRKSIRQFDVNNPMSIQQLNLILEESYRAPSSMNLQGSRYFIIQSKEAKEKLKSVLLGNELQLNTASFFVLIAFDTLKFDLGPAIYDKAVNLGLMPKTVRDEKVASFDILKHSISHEKLYRDGYIDGGLLSMQLMLVAKSHGFDTCAIGGFRHDEINHALNIDKRYVPVLMIAIGKAAEQGYQSVRLNLEDVTTIL